MFLPQGFLQSCMTFSGDHELFTPARASTAGFYQGLTWGTSELVGHIYGTWGRGYL